MSNYYKLAFSLAFILLSNFLTVNGCHYSSLTLTSTVDNGNGTYTITFDVCLGQKQNWGATSSFSICPSGGSFSSISSFTPASTTNNYQVGGGPCGSAQSVSATASGSIGGGCVNYSTSGSTPGGFPLVPDRQDGGANSLGNANSYCFTMTITTVGYPATITLSGEETDPSVWCGGDDGDNSPCNGTPEADETITLPAPVLPVALNYFNARANGSDIILKWATSMEDDLASIAVQRYFPQTDAHGESHGKIAHSEWETIGTLDAHGASEYQYVTTNTNELTAFRLQFNDLNGNASHSQVLYVNTDHSHSPAIMLYPNPASEQLYVTVGTDDIIEWVKIRDLSGRLIASGSNTHIFDVSGLDAGIYLIEVMLESRERVLEKLIIE